MSFWDRLDCLRAVAARHPDGMVDLTKGEPVDPVPMIIQRALAGAANAPGYPLTRGTAALRESAAVWLARCHGVSVPSGQVLPTIGSKEFIGLLPLMLGLGPEDAVGYPELAYPSYAAGARLAGAETVASDDVTARDPVLPSGRRIRLIWLNSPANPTGRVWPAESMRRIVGWARKHDVVVASDECYLDYGWDAAPVSLLAPAVAGESHTGLVSVYSLSKRSNLAGYRAGVAAGDPELMDRMWQRRREIGLITPAPVQRAVIAALDDDAHVKRQRERYAHRRALLRATLSAAGWTIDHSEAGLFLWARCPALPGWTACERLAEAGILATPGDMYGDAGRRHVRFAVTASDMAIEIACRRLHTAVRP
ncbi:succinyldiaminopimelate transaminase [Microbispora sp. NPDC088329]|uniref:succinyldiaminopimelate transaminase n=1 Tax=Microbispora sp. NPDC088329 TaxID=3154869 RepID=UPI00343FFF80